MHFAKAKGITEDETFTDKTIPPKRLLEEASGEDGNEEDDLEAKRRRILEETRDIDADSMPSDSGSSEEDR